MEFQYSVSLDRALYEGFWRNDKPHHGRLIIANGDLYKGEWENNKMARCILL